MEQPRVVLDVGGVPVGVRASDERLRFLTERVGDIESSKEATLVVTMRADTPERPDRPADQSREGVDAWYEESILWMQIGRAVAKVTPGSVEIGGDIDNKTAYKWIDLMVQYSVAAAIVAPDRLMVHGAVVARGDSALLIVGKSGAGKSTASTAALVHGWDLLTDDLAVARPVVGRVSGVARPPRLPADLAGRHGMKGRVEAGKRGRIVLSPSALSQGDRQLVGLVMVGHGEHGELEGLPKGDLHAIDDAMAVPPFAPVIRSHLAAAAALVAIPTFRLSHAVDENLRVDRAAELLDKALTRALGESDRRSQ